MTVEYKKYLHNQRSTESSVLSNISHREIRLSGDTKKIISKLNTNEVLFEGGKFTRYASRFSTWALLAATLTPNQNYTIYIDSNIDVLASVTIPSNINLFFIGGGFTIIGASVILSIYGSINAPQNDKIFTYVSGGTCFIAVSGSSNILPEWFGAVGDGVIDDTTAFKNAIESLGGLTGALYIQNKTYNLASNTTITTPEYLRIKGAGKGASTISISNGFHFINNYTIHIEDLIIFTVGKIIQNNGVGESNITLSNIGVFAQGTVDQTKYLVEGVSGKNINIIDCNINLLGTASRLAGVINVTPRDSSDKVTIDGCVVENNGQEAIKLTDINNIIIENCVFNGGGFNAGSYNKNTISINYDTSIGFNTKIDTVKFSNLYGRSIFINKTGSNPADGNIDVSNINSRDNGVHTNSGDIYILTLNGNCNLDINNIFTDCVITLNVAGSITGNNIVAGSSSFFASVNYIISNIKDFFTGNFRQIETKTTVVTSDGGLAQVLNCDVASVVAGEIVHINGINTITKSPGNSTKSIGVANDSISVGNSGKVTIKGVVSVLLKDGTSSTAGNWVKMSDTAGRADATTSSKGTGSTNAHDENLKHIGYALESKSSGTNVLCKIII